MRIANISMYEDRHGWNLHNETGKTIAFIFTAVPGFYRPWDWGSTSELTVRFAEKYPGYVPRILTVTNSVNIFPPDLAQGYKKALKFIQEMEL